jgi:hypothetical protein
MTMEFTSWLWVAMVSLAIVVVVQWLELRAVRARLDQSGRALIWLVRHTGTLGSRVEHLEELAQLSRAD